MDAVCALINNANTRSSINIYDIILWFLLKLFQLVGRFIQWRIYTPVYNEIKGQYFTLLLKYVYTNVFKPLHHIF